MRRASLVVFVGLVLMLAPGFAQTVTIGFTASDTGKLKVNSSEQYRGFELWRDQTNAAGGIKAGGKSYKIQFAKYDDESNSKRVQQLYARMILQDKADFLFSPYSSSLAHTAAVVTEQYGKIMLTTGAAEEKTYQLGNKYLFQMFAPANQYLTTALDAVKDKDPKAMVAFVYKDDAFPKAVSTPAIEYAKKIGLQVVFTEAYSPSTTDFGPILDKLIASKATVLLGGGHFDDSSTMARQLYARKAALKAITLLVAPDSPKWAELGDSGFGVAVPSQWDSHVHAKSQFGPTVEQFVKDYRAKYNNENPSYESAGGYAAGLILQRAIEQAGTLETAKVAEKLNAVDAMTFYGRVKFSTDPKEHGLQKGHSMILAQWQKDKTGNLIKEVVWPKELKSTNMKYPIR